MSSPASAIGAEHPVVKSPLTSRLLKFPAGVSLVERETGSPGVTYPRGFLASGLATGIKGSGRPDMAVLAVAPEYRARASSAAVFTTNAFAAAPVVIDREECDLGHLVAVVINSGNANACTGEAGFAVARGMRQACAEELGVPPRQVAVGSTGIIGVPLDANVATRGVRQAAAALQPDGGPAFAHAILTTDLFPKVTALAVETTQGSVRLGGCVKGAGMISPAMATMLCVVTTDAQLSGEQAQSLLQRTVDRTFNRITVDGEMSTNDSVFFLASGASGAVMTSDDLVRFEEALGSLLLHLALMIVADGEGATKVIKVKVTGAEDDTQAARVARAIAESPLVKTAMHGGDPNWGRIVSAAGAAMAGRRVPNASLWLADVLTFAKGAARPLSQPERTALAEAMKQPEIDIRLDLGLGPASWFVFFSDLGHDYITINAEYHT